MITPKFEITGTLGDCKTSFVQINKLLTKPSQTIDETWLVVTYWTALAAHSELSVLL